MHRLMTVPGVGSVVALTYRATVDVRTLTQIKAFARPNHNSRPEQLVEKVDAAAKAWE